MALATSINGTIRFSDTTGSDIPVSSLTCSFTGDPLHYVAALEQAEQKAREFQAKLRAAVQSASPVNASKWPRIPRDKPRLRRRGQKRQGWR